MQDWRKLRAGERLIIAYGWCHVFYGWCVQSMRNGLSCRAKGMLACSYCRCSDVSLFAQVTSPPFRVFSSRLCFPSARPVSTSFAWTFSTQSMLVWYPSGRPFSCLVCANRQFIARGYGVIYLGREGCAAPFARRFQELVSNNVDLEFMNKLVLGGKKNPEKTGRTLTPHAMGISQKSATHDLLLGVDRSE